MTVRYFPALLACMTVSFVVLAAGLVVSVTSWFWVPAAVLPLMYYHLGFLRPRIAKATDSAAIDSVYYFGFLITVAALALSAVSMGRTTAPDFHLVLVKFGIGMVATGYALIARMHLQSLATPDSSQTAESVMDAYVHRTQELVDNVETAIVRVNSFSQIVLDETRETHIRAQAQIEQSLIDSARAFQKELGDVGASIREGISSIGGLLDDISSSTERTELLEVVKSTVITARELTTSMKVFSDQFMSGADAVLTTKAAIEAIEPSFHQFNVVLDQIGAPEGNLAHAANSLLSLTDASTKAADSARDALRTTADLTRQFDAQGTMFVAMGEFAKTASQQFDNLGKTGAGLDVALSEFAKAIETADTLSQNLSKVQASLPELTVELEALTRKLAELKESVSTAARDLEADVRRSAEATMLLTTSLTGVAQNIIHQTRVHQGITS